MTTDASPWQPCSSCGYARAYHNVYGMCPPGRAPSTAQHVTRTLYTMLKIGIVVAALIIVAIVGYEWFWQATHCTTILGTQVCN